MPARAQEFGQGAALQCLCGAALVRSGRRGIVHGTPGSRIGWRLPFPQGHVSSGSRTSPRDPQGAEQDGLLPFQVVVPVLPDGGVDPGLDHQVEGQVVRGVWGVELAAEPAVDEPADEPRGDVHPVAVPQGEVEVDLLGRVSGLAGSGIGPVKVGEGPAGADAALEEVDLPAGPASPGRPAATAWPPAPPGPTAGPEARFPTFRGRGRCGSRPTPGTAGSCAAPDRDRLRPRGRAGRRRGPGAASGRRCGRRAAPWSCRGCIGPGCRARGAAHPSLRSCGMRAGRHPMVPCACRSPPGFWNTESSGTHSARTAPSFRAGGLTSKDRGNPAGISVFRGTFWLKTFPMNIDIDEAPRPLWP